MDICNNLLIFIVMEKIFITENIVRNILKEISEEKKETEFQTFAKKRYEGAKKIAENATRYKGSHPCPTCGIIMNPVEFLSSNKGRCLSCVTQERTKRAKNKMVN